MNSSYLFYLQVDTIDWSDDGTFIYSIKNDVWEQKAAELITWTIHRGNEPTTKLEVKQSPRIYSKTRNIHFIAIYLILLFSLSKVQINNSNNIFIYNNYCFCYFYFHI
ncbi:hypothetical protein DPMN_166363 [Dreissena polymorpha]|uniref:Uncharacterized protein n=1 Tax=Dreissena polymorpha TaxID=45954 RepID=A0A9D4EYH7_DREPO|nr:hypothetical protein DPMN_166363 [Dreissena polymorpha]